VSIDKQNKSNETDAHGKYTSAYVEILNSHAFQIKESVTKKNELKTKFLQLITVIMLLLTILFIGSVYFSFKAFESMIINDYESVSVIVGAVTGMITTLSTMILSIFKLPEIVANYLFNKEEDKQMIEINKNIQTYELEAVKLEKLEIIKQEKELANTENSDSPLERSPSTSGMQPESTISTNLTAVSSKESMSIPEKENIESLDLAE